MLKCRLDGVPSWIICVLRKQSMLMGKMWQKMIVSGFLFFIQMTTRLMALYGRRRRKINLFKIIKFWSKFCVFPINFENTLYGSVYQVDLGFLFSM